MATTTNDQAKAPTRALAYARVSTQAQADAGGLDVQITKIHDWAAQNDIEIVEVFSEVQDGRLSKTEERPQLYACGKSALVGGYLIVATDPSRITRSVVAAEFLDSTLRNRFRFLKRVPGYGNQDWSAEVREKHSHLQESVSTGTIIAMDKLKRDGQKFGGPDGGKAGRAASVKVRGSKKQLRLKAIADFLEADPERLTMSRRVLCPLLDQAGIHPARSESWSVDALRRPLSEAKQLLAAQPYRGGQKSEGSGAPPSQAYPESEFPDGKLPPMWGTF